MSSQFRWLVEDQVIAAYLYGDVDVADLEKGNLEVTRMLDESHAEQVHVVFDTLEMVHLRFSVLEAANKLGYLSHPRLGWFVVYGSEGILYRMSNFAGTILSNLTHMKFRMFHTQQEAVQFIQQVDSTLPPLSGFNLAKPYAPAGHEAHPPE